MLCVSLMFALRTRKSMLPETTHSDSLSAARWDPRACCLIRSSVLRSARHWIVCRCAFHLLVFVRQGSTKRACIIRCMSGSNSGGSLPPIQLSDCGSDGSSLNFHVYPFIHVYFSQDKFDAFDDIMQAAGSLPVLVARTSWSRGSSRCAATRTCRTP